MSTNEPPAGAAQEGAPEYGQPQDPWAGGFDYTPGQSSVPTDPIPHQYDPYQSYEGPYAGGPDPWGHGPTQGQPWMAPPKPSRAVPVLVLVIALLVIGGGGGAAAWYFLTHQDDRVTTTDPTAGVTTPANGGPTASSVKPSPTAPKFDPTVVKVNDCLVNNGSNVDPDLKVVSCDPVPDRDVFRVIKIVSGSDIGQDDDGKLSVDEAQAACAGSKFERYYKNDFDDDSRDIVFCMVVVKQQ
jgi:hypothetical protein